MTKLDGLKERLAELRFWRGIAVAVIIGIFGWIFTSYKTTDNLLLCCGVGVIAIVAVIMLAICFAINDKIKEIEKL